MNQNKQLVIWASAIFGVATLLVVGVAAHDRGVDQAVVDHLFDFHFNIQEAEEADRARWEAEKHEQAEKQRHYNEFTDEVTQWWRSDSGSSSNDDRGTYTPPENNGNRD